MGCREVHFCDWCEIEAPHSGIPDDWIVLTYGGELLCSPCKAERETALYRAKETCRMRAVVEQGGEEP